MLVLFVVFENDCRSLEEKKKKTAFTYDCVSVFVFQVSVTRVPVLTLSPVAASK